MTEAFRRTISVAVINNVVERLSEEESKSAWATEVLADSRISEEATRSIVTKRFGERAVIASPGDPIANANAAASGCAVVHGGSLPSGAWANVRKSAAMPTSSSAFPTARPEAMVDQEGGERVCKSCRRPI